MIIASIPLDDVHAGNRKRYNTNNNWVNNEPPEDYDKVIAETRTSSWVDIFKEHYVVVNIDADDVVWMKRAWNTGKLTIRFPHMYDDELEEFLERKKDLEGIIGSRDWFVRTENVSMKNGKFGAGPYRDLRSIIISMVTSISGHSAFKHDTKSIKLYFFPWVEIDPSKEFRIFVHNRRITAVSQQNLYTPNQILTEDEEPEKTAEGWVEKINAYFRRSIKESILLDSYVLDIALIGDDTPYPIELNSFGTEYASGSALFGWIQDKNILYGRHDEIHFRYTGN